MQEFFCAAVRRERTLWRPFKQKTLPGLVFIQEWNELQQSLQKQQQLKCMSERRRIGTRKFPIKIQSKSSKIKNTSNPLSLQAIWHLAQKETVSPWQLRYCCYSLQKQSQDSYLQVPLQHPLDAEHGLPARPFLCHVAQRLLEKLWILPDRNQFQRSRRHLLRLVYFSSWSLSLKQAFWNHFLIYTANHHPSALVKISRLGAVPVTVIKRLLFRGQLLDPDGSLARQYSWDEWFVSQWSSDSKEPDFSLWTETIQFLVGNIANGTSPMRVWLAFQILSLPPHPSDLLAKGQTGFDAMGEVRGIQYSTKEAQILEPSLVQDGHLTNQVIGGLCSTLQQTTEEIWLRGHWRADVMLKQAICRVLAWCWYRSRQKCLPIALFHDAQVKDRLLGLMGQHLPWEMILAVLRPLLSLNKSLLPLHAIESLIRLLAETRQEMVIDDVNWKQVQWFIMKLVETASEQDQLALKQCIQETHLMVDSLTFISWIKKCEQLNAQLKCPQV